MCATRVQLTSGCVQLTISVGAIALEIKSTPTFICVARFIVYPKKNIRKVIKKEEESGFTMTHSKDSH